MVVQDGTACGKGAHHSRWTIRGDFESCLNDLAPSAPELQCRSIKATKDLEHLGPCGILAASCGIMDVPEQLYTLDSKLSLVFLQVC